MQRFGVPVCLLVYLILIRRRNSEQPSRSQVVAGEKRKRPVS